MGGRLPNYVESELQNVDSSFFSFHDMGTIFEELSGAVEIARLNFLSNTPVDSFDFGDTAPTVLLVQGWGCKSGAMSTLGDFLKPFMNVTFAEDFPYLNTCSIADAAKILAPKIEKLARKREVTLIGHSNGGMIMLAALHLATRTKVKNAITLGTPHRGTKLATFASPVSKACKEINLEGGFLEGINLSKKIIGNLKAGVAAKDIVVPPESQIPSGDITPGKDIEVTVFKDYGHFDFIIGEKSRKVGEIIKSDILN